MMLKIGTWIKLADAESLEITTISKCRKLEDAENW